MALKEIYLINNRVNNKSLAHRDFRVNVLADPGRNTLKNIVFVEEGIYFGAVNDFAPWSDHVVKVFLQL